jgi:hypothetical protein
MQMMLTGLKGPDRLETRAHQLAQQRLPLRDELPRIFVQPIRRVRRQGLPDCAGEAFGGGIHGVSGFDASGRQLWREAQRREWGGFDPNAGALLEYAVEGILHRGISPYVAGEEQDHSAGLESWTEGHAAHDTRQIGAIHYRVGDLPELYAAIAGGLVVVDGGGVTGKYMGRGPADAVTTPADLDELGGNENGHAQRLAGYYLDSPWGNLILYQNSWGPEWGGCYLPDGSWQAGCTWALERVFRERWDCHALEVRIS